jgi:cyclopropane-fatty-acyl-phospholipid synthase
MIGLVSRMAEAGLFPDPAVRFGIRRILRGRLRQSVWGDVAVRTSEEDALIRSLGQGPIAISVDAANEQHYEVPAAFFEHVLGARLKYSCGYWDSATPDLDAAEEKMLALSAERAGIEDGMTILDLGCGWGSFTLWAAERYPNAQLLGVSNSRLQRELILRRASERGLGNVRVETSDINDFAPSERFDRIVSVEMLEHVRNHPALFERMAGWLAPQGAVFAHIFCHRSRAYTYEVQSASDWMAQHFFTGGMMPSEGLFRRYQEHLQLRDQWRVDGRHYQRTCDAWLAKLDAQREVVMPILRQGYGKEAEHWFHRWRLFFMACSELFGYGQGEEWFVAHYRWDGSPG